MNDVARRLFSGVGSTPGTPVTFRAVTRSVDGVGQCKTDVPLKVQPVEPLIDSLRVHVKHRAFHFERGGSGRGIPTF
jgi:hypothetical protein